MTKSANAPIVPNLPSTHDRMPSGGKRGSYPPGGREALARQLTGTSKPAKPAGKQSGK